MKLHFSFHKKITHIEKHDVFNPRKWWVIMLGICTGLFVLTLLFGLWYFMHVSQQLEADVVAAPTSNERKIQTLEQSVDEIQKAVDERVGQGN